MRSMAVRIALSSVAVTAAAVAVIVVGVFGFAARSFQQLMVEHGDTVADARAMFDDSVAGFFVLATAAGVLGSIALRSEEHTSELQSRGHLVCRLLLE